MDLNKILSLWPYLLGGLAIAGLYVPDAWRWVMSWKSAAPAAPAGDRGQGTGDGAAPVPVGQLAEYLKAISNHCASVKDDAALQACDQIAPTLFHEKKPDQPAAPKAA